MESIARATAGQILTPMPQLTPEYIDYDEGPSAIRVMTALITLTTLVIIIRFWVRVKRRIPFGLEDWSMAVALLLAWALCALAVYSIRYGGFGKHLVAVMFLDPGGNTFKKGQFVEWIGELIYVSLITTIKFSVLSMYHRIFPTRFVQWGVITLGTIAAMWFVSITLVVVFQCSPIPKAWDKTIATGTCIDLEKFFLGNSIPNILTDLAILCLPVYEVYHLKVNRGEKIGLVVVFLLGGLVVIVSIVRLKVLIDIVQEGLDADFTLEMNRANIWTVVEPAIGMISASIPPLRPLIAMLSHALGMSSRQKASGQKKAAIQHSIVTIGGSGPSGFLPKALRSLRGEMDTEARDRADSFERLPDSESNSGQNQSDTILLEAVSEQDGRLVHKSAKPFV